MAEQDADILKTIAETVNGLGDYLRKQAEKNPESSWPEIQNLPRPIDLPTTDHSATTPEVEEVVIPLPRRPLYDEGYMLEDKADGEAEAVPYSIHLHYSYSGAAASFPREDTIYSRDGFLYSSLLINLTVRKCASDLPTTIIDHPGYKKPVISGGMWGVGGGIPIDTYGGDDGTWLELSYGAFDDAGVDLGHGNKTISGFSIHARITTEGTLELRATKDAASPWLSCVITGAIWRVNYSTPPYIQEVGLGGCHDDDIWPNDVWTGIL